METTTTQTKKSTAAGDIRIALKAAFAGVKFSVRTETSGTVRIGWVDGPSSDAVEAVVGRFEDGSFDGMTDSYTYAPADPSTPNRARFVFCHREISDAILAAVKADMTARFGAGESERYIDETVYRLLRKSDLSGGYAGLHHSERGWEIIEERPIVRAKVAA